MKSKGLRFLFCAFRHVQIRGLTSEKDRKYKKAARIFGDYLQNFHKKIDDFLVSVYYGKRWSGSRRLCGSAAREGALRKIMSGGFGMKQARAAAAVRNRLQIADASL